MQRHFLFSINGFTTVTIAELISGLYSIRHRLSTFYCYCIFATERSIIFRELLEDDFFTLDRETLVDIGAYCLMPNHFHLLVREKNNGGISAFMKNLNCLFYVF